MRLEGPDRQSIELKIIGYAYPHDTSSEYDANWLMVEGSVTHPRGSWTFRDPCLLTWEASALADWLDQVASGTQSSNHAGSIEPNLEFRIVGDRPHQSLRVLFELESRPHWAPSRAAGAENLWIDIPTDPQALRNAAASLREQLREHPRRNVESPGAA